MGCPIRSAKSKNSVAGAQKREEIGVNNAHSCPRVYSRVLPLSMGTCKVSLQAFLSKPPDENDLDGRSGR